VSTDDLQARAIRLRKANL